MRAVYLGQLNALHELLGQMCDMAGEAMARSTHALLRADLAVAEEVITDHEQIVRMSADAEERAFALLALQAPVAGDLRAIVTTFQIVADVDRMGALALHVAKVARRRHPDKAVPEDVHGCFAEMGNLAVNLANNASEALKSQNPEDAMRLREDDDAMDALHKHLFTVLLDRNWQHSVPCAVDVTLLGRYYERFADHAVLIGQRVVFQATGRSPSPSKKS